MKSLIDYINESILSSTKSGKHYDPLSNLKRQSFQLREKHTEDDAVKAFMKFYDYEARNLFDKSTESSSKHNVQDSVKDAMSKIYNQLQLDHMKPKGSFNLILDKNAAKVVLKLYNDSRISIDQNPPVCPNLGNEDTKYLPLLVTIDDPMLGEKYFIWYWGCTQDLFGHGANHWLEVHKKD